ncbi:MAG: SH3 domain-containing protein [Acidobacteriota bacterium]
MNFTQKQREHKNRTVFYNLMLVVVIILGVTASNYSQSGSGEATTKPSSAPKTKTKKKAVMPKKNAVDRKSKNIPKAMVTSLKVNFRISPSNYADSLGTVTYGEVLLVLDKNHVNGWYNVKHIPTNITGWVYGNTITLIR